LNSGGDDARHFNSTFEYRFSRYGRHTGLVPGAGGPVRRRQEQRAFRPCDDERRRRTISQQVPRNVVMPTGQRASHDTFRQPR